MRPAPSFFPDRGLKRTVIGLILSLALVFQISPAEPKTSPPLKVPPPAFGLAAVKQELKNLLKDWKEVEFHVDDVLIRHVSYYIKYYAVEDVDRSNKAIRRSEEYLHHIICLFKKYGLPEDAAFALPFVESSFNPGARSGAGAVGMFQFLESTARDYGLKINNNGDDERADVQKAAEACAKYLRNNRRVFASTILSLAGYHHGTKLVTDVLLSYGNEPQRTFGPIFRNKKLGPFSREYIPQCLAAALIYRHLKQNKLKELQVPRFESRTLVAKTKVTVLHNEIPGLSDLNPDLGHATSTYDYASTNGYVLLTKLNYPPPGAEIIRTLPPWAQNPEPVPSGSTKVKGLPKTIHYIAQTHNDLPGIAAVFGTSVKALRFNNRYLAKRRLRPKDIIEIKGMAPTTQAINGKNKAGSAPLSIKTLENETLETFCIRAVRTIRLAWPESPWEMGTDLTPELIYYWNHDALGNIQPDTPLEENLSLAIYSDYRWYKSERGGRFAPDGHQNDAAVDQKHLFHQID